MFCLHLNLLWLHLNRFRYIFICSVHISTCFIHISTCSIYSWHLKKSSNVQCHVFSMCTFTLCISHQPYVFSYSDTFDSTLFVINRWNRSYTNQNGLPYQVNLFGWYMDGFNRTLF